MSKPRLAFEPASRQSLRRGFNFLANTLEVTLGPRGRLVAVARENSRRAPELLNDGANIARRISDLPDRFESMGALLARHIAWKVEEAVGDGATTAVIIASSIINEVDRHVAGGANPMRIRRGLEKALPRVLHGLAGQARPLEAAQQIEALATAITRDTVLGKYVEEAFDVVGPHGTVQVRTNYARTHDRRYINGAFWNQGWVSSNFTTEAGKAVVKDPYILFTNRHLQRAEDLIPIMELIREDGERGLVVIATEITGDALNILVTNKEREVMPTLAIKAPGFGPEKTDILEDLAAMCGGQVILEETISTAQDVTLAELGQATEVQAIRSGFTLIGGKGRPAIVRKRSQELRSKIPTARYGRERDRLVERAGKLLGGVALIEVGSATDSERDFLKERTQEAIHVVRQGMVDGVVPGGGSALLASAHSLDEMCLPDEEAAAVPILRGALFAPTEAILRNSGFEPAPIVAQLLRGGPECGFDVLTESYADMMEANIVDPVRVVQTAVEIGVSAAMMAITTDVLVHKPRSNRSEEVDFNP